MATKASLSSLKRRRAEIKGRLTKFDHFLSSIPETTDIDLLKIKEEAFIKHFQDLSIIHDQLTEIDPDHIEDHLEERDNMEDQHDILLARARKILRTNEKFVNNRNASNPPQPVASATPLIKLPEIALPRFDGNIENWFSFKDKFITRIHSNANIADVDKLQYLHSCLSDKAARTIDSLEGTGDNYVEAWNILNAKYNNTRKAILRHWSILNQIPKLVRDTPESLDELVDTFKQHLRALKGLGEPIEGWNTCIIYLLISKIGESTKYHWEMTLNDNKMPSYISLLEFLEKRGNCAEQSRFDVKPFSKKYEAKGPISRGQTFITNISKNTKGNKLGQCPICNNHHSIFKCDQFRGMSVNQRRESVTKAGLCYNCLGAGHSVKTCKSGTCRVCNQKHNSFLHYVTSVPQPITAPNVRVSDSSSDLDNTPTNSSEVNPATVLSLNSSDDILPTAVLHVVRKDNTPVICRAIIDTGSTRNFISEDLASMLQLPRTNCNIPIGALNELSTVAKHSVRVTIKSRINEFARTLEFLVVPQITQLTPDHEINRKNIEIPRNLCLADPEFYKPAPIQLLLGTSTALSTLCVGQIVIPSQGSDLILQKTQLGWIIGGNVPLYKRNSRAKCYMTELHSDISQFWEIEAGAPIKHYSEEEQACQKHFKENIRREKDGRFTVSLPFNKHKNQLGDSYSMALKRLESLGRRFQRNPTLKTQYHEVISDYLKLGYMTKVESQDKKGFYLPHQAVIKEGHSTTKVRVVFDASAASSSGLSLNDSLLGGPTIQDDIFSLLLRFRLHNHVLTGDIEKMYLQIKINETDQEYLRILWEDDNKLVIAYQFNRLIFGLKPASYLATRCLHELADSEKAKYPRAAAILKTDLYVDDLLTGADTREEIIEIKEEMINLLRSGGFNLHKCASDVTEILDTSSSRSVNLELQNTDTIKTLGIHWNANSDSIIYTIKPIIQTKVTKRAIFSEVAKIYDPLGLLNPIIVVAKLLIQELWKLKIDWDESLPIELHTRWQNFVSHLITLKEVSFPRKMLCEQYVDIQLHGFCDASEKAYGACIYLRSVDVNKRVQVELYCARSRVAPLKNIQTIPRLELCAAVLLSQLYKSVRSSINIPVSHTFFWTDSLITLHWIKTSPHLLQTFVANRVADIRTGTNVDDWRHVRTFDNPADLLSRGVLPKDFENGILWTHGPAWLKQEEDMWPLNNLIFNSPVPELRKTICLISPRLDTSLLTRYSSFSRLQRIVALILRFKPDHQNKGSLTVEELGIAFKRIISLVQQAEFTSEYKSLIEGQGLQKKSNLLVLNPFIDNDGLIRVGGRLHNSPFPFQLKHPIILPKSHHVTKLIINKAHLDTLHGGVQTTLNALRQTYWPIDGKNQVRGVIRKCVRCARCKPVPVDYIMASLPRVRTNQTRPFCNVGVDYCGPFFIKEKRIRNRNRIKIYVAVFVCLVTKAVHLEAAGDLTTEGFLAVLKRFIARRGKCSSIYSDNGTNFVGANRELQELQALFASESQKNQISDYLAEKGITWHFNPPGSPHFGGIWEAAVKSFKHHLRRVVGIELFSYEQFNTLIIDIEAILNSRPLTPLSCDPNDLCALTPAHFLIGEPSSSLPEQVLTGFPANRLSAWKHIQKVKQDFWNRWSKEYVSQLNVRGKWTKGDHPIKIGSIVLVREDNLPPLQWLLGRVVAIYPGSDGIVRTVCVKTRNGEIIRAVKRLAPLPVDSE